MIGTNESFRSDRNNKKDYSPAKICKCLNRIMCNNLLHTPDLHKCCQAANQSRS